MTTHIPEVLECTGKDLPSQNDEDSLDKGLFKQLLDTVADSNEGLIPGRNDPCYCGSGNKYKKCCLKKDQETQKSLEITPDKKIRLEELTIVSEPIEEPYSSLTESEESQVSEFYWKLMDQPDDIADNEISFLKGLCNKYPDNPTLWNHLSCAYQAMHDMEKVREITETIVQQFPGYLFGCVNMANILMEEDEIEKAEEVLCGKYTLTQFYPERNTFHISEFISLQTALISLSIHKDHFEYAQRLYDMLLSAAVKFEEEEHPMILSITNKLRKAKLSRKFTVAMNRFKQ